MAGRQYLARVGKAVCRPERGQKGYPEMRRNGDAVEYNTYWENEICKGLSHIVELVIDHGSSWHMARDLCSLEVEVVEAYWKEPQGRTIT